VIQPGQNIGRRIRMPVLVCLSLLALICLASEVAACPTCKDTIAGNDDDTAQLVQGYFWSIIFMLSMPVCIFCGLTTYFYLQVRRARRTGELPADGAHALLKRPLDARTRQQLEDLAHAP
jgi:hypothetical protein